MALFSERKRQKSIQYFQIRSDSKLAKIMIRWNIVVTTFLVLTGTALFSVVEAGSISNIVVFGDSLSDVGNAHDLTFGLFPPSPPYYQGRFSNGPVWVESLADDLNIPRPTPSRDSGTNFAFGGAETGTGISSMFTPNLGTQVSSYLSSNTPSDDSLFILWGGGNDMTRSPEVPVGEIIDNIAERVTTLATAGVESLLVPNLPPLGSAPRFLGTSQEPVINDRVIEFNALLTTRLDSLANTFGVEIYQLDVYSTMQTYIDNPAAFGLSNVTDPALNTGNGQVVPNPSEYLFWDDFHPTTVAHRVLAEEAARLVPEPSLFILLLTGLSTLAGATGSKRA